MAARKMTWMEIIALVAAVIFVVLVVLFGCFGCAHQELANVANQGKHETSKIKEWGKSTIETVTSAMQAMDTLDSEIAELAQLEDREVIASKAKTIETKINSIGEALYTIDYKVPIERAERAGQCFDAILDFTGKQPEHADDETLALHLFRLGEAKLRLERFKSTIAKLTATIAPAIPAMGWIDSILKIVLGSGMLAAGAKGIHEKIKRKKAEQHFGFVVKGIRDLKTSNGPMYESMKETMTNTVPQKHKAGFDAAVAHQLANG